MGGVRGGGVERKWKKTHGHGQQSCDRGEGHVRGLNCKGKNTITNKEQEPAFRGGDLKP